MRGDFILPAVLVVALTAMAVYATSEGGNDKSPMHTSPVACQDVRLISRLGDIPEASGLAASARHPQLFWAHNDSAEPVVFGIAADGTVRGRVRIAGASVADWEAVTTAKCANGTCLFVGDIGDNDRARRSITVYRTTEPSPEDSASRPADAIEGVYPEGPQDAEAIFVADGSLFVITKGERSPIRVYRFPTLESGAAHTLQLVATLSPGPADKSIRITDAAVSPDQRWVALRSNEAVFFYDVRALVAGTPGSPLSYDVRGLREPQGEGVAWADSRTLFLAGEGEGAGTFARISCNLPG